MALLEVTDLCAGYNAADVLRGVTFAVEQGGSGGNDCAR